MKATTYAAIGIASACLITACVVLEDRISRSTTPGVASAIVDAGCTGGVEFVESAIAGLNPGAAQLIMDGVETACALRAKRKPISATIYDTPLESFCADVPALTAAEAELKVRSAFNSHRADTCEASE